MNPYYIACALKKYIDENHIDHIFIEDKDYWPFKFRKANNKLIAVLNIITFKKTLGICDKIIKVNPINTSITCNKCGSIDKESRCNKSLFHCTNCNYRTNADMNAAKNILRIGINTLSY